MAALPPSLVCRNKRCRRRKPAVEFVMRDNPEWVRRGYATRHWCAACLVAGGHVAESFARDVIAFRLGDDAPEPLPPVTITAEQRARAREKVREHALAVELADRAAEDPTFMAAVRRVAAAW